METPVQPTLLVVDDDDVLHVVQEHPDESLRERVEEAVRQCPKQAISIED